MINLDNILITSYLDYIMQKHRVKRRNEILTPVWLSTARLFIDDTWS